MNNGNELISFVVRFNSSVIYKGASKKEDIKESFNKTPSVSYIDCGFVKEIPIKYLLESKSVQDFLNEECPQYMI